MEIWKVIPHWEGSYEASTLGHIRSIERKVLCRGALRKQKGVKLRPLKHPGGYIRVCLWRDGKADSNYVHTLVLETFIGPRPAGMQACHLNGDKKDCRLVNLRWDYPSENQSDRDFHGTGQFGKPRSVTTLKAEDIPRIRACVEKHGGNRTKAAKELGMSRTTVADIANKRTWSKIT